MYEIIILKEGYNASSPTGRQQSCGTSTLIKGKNNIIVDTGSPWDKDVIIERLREYGGLSPDQINYVVCTHGHGDHVGNLNLFQNAIHIVSYDICHRDEYYLHDFHRGIPYEIDENIEVIPTPGHTGADVSVIVTNTAYGVVVIAGDLFECAEDLDDTRLWRENSENPVIQEMNRADVLQIADYIIPGHGTMFEVPSIFKKEFKVVILEENVTIKDFSSGSGRMVEHSSSMQISFASEPMVDTGASSSSIAGPSTSALATQSSYHVDEQD